jgi:hypothetical protein
MIRIDDYAWPLVLVTIGPDNLDTAAAQLHAFGRLCSAEPRVIALVIPGVHDQSLGNLDRLLHWVRKFELQLMPHTIRLAWVVEDEAVRATVSALLRVQDDHAFGCPTGTFASTDDAVEWLHATEPGRRGGDRDKTLTVRADGRRGL